MVMELWIHDDDEYAHCRSEMCRAIEQATDVSTEVISAYSSEKLLCTCICYQPHLVFLSNPERTFVVKNPASAE
jgi:hypothetical protein